MFGLCARLVKFAEGTGARVVHYDALGVHASRFEK